MEETKYSFFNISLDDLMKIDSESIKNKKIY